MIIGNHSHKLNLQTTPTKRSYIDGCRLMRMADHIAHTWDAHPLVVFEALTFQYDCVLTTDVKRAIVHTYWINYTVDRYGYIIPNERHIVSRCNPD